MPNWNHLISSKQYRYCPVKITSLRKIKMKFPVIGRINSSGNFDRRYAIGLGRTFRQQRADLLKSFYPNRVPRVPRIPRIPNPRIF